ncbi:hypothetical protein TPHA_0K02130 [Tetrapisispora phaffii CBS 4417]|uniref:Flavodoxin-like fold domain-containing protein n=1 Tax=Tetrapisispora phaffii (strain ATCC 24235 / CBS 4417 / NBRC 1672 / NRRL Y-8282 / UCD 70-5) TaxID=1071381 RepID=G8BZL6_TETPH|nr:hypothetical protein TPHA_0K02130 [Tetrapisispora phaffii CBS 4417]CCE65344.1 hypothetical protein TPHA_0K02130 [Tetrapisispora phaffii CBS 4417]
MKVFIVTAHPDTRSLTHSLLSETVKRFEKNGHEVKVSDLYQMKWKATVDEDDFKNHPKGERLEIAAASGAAYANNQLTDDVVAEQEKLKWCDLLILQFPLWWFSMPAILKGWVERVYSLGLAYGTFDRYGHGNFVGKKACLMVTLGGKEAQYSNNGVNGPIEDLLFPINRNILFYTGFSVLPSFLTFGANKFGEKEFNVTVERLNTWVDNIENEKPYNYRKQNDGQFDENLQLKPEFVNPAKSGFSQLIDFS